MYNHLPNVLAKNPDYILLHVSTNDCMSKTSDEVLLDLTKIKQHIETLLPSCTLIISQPIVRADNNKAAQIVKNLNTKIKRSISGMKLDNSNIKVKHLGTKGLHLNGYGTRMMAGNIISLIRRL